MIDMIAILLIIALVLVMFSMILLVGFTLVNWKDRKKRK